MQKAVYHQSIKDWPEGDRPRERLIKHGSDALTDAELLLSVHNQKPDDIKFAASILKQIFEKMKKGR